VIPSISILLLSSVLLVLALLDLLLVLVVDLLSREEPLALASMFFLLMYWRFFLTGVGASTPMPTGSDSDTVVDVAVAVGESVVPFATPPLPLTATLVTTEWPFSTTSCGTSSTSPTGVVGGAASAAAEGLARFRGGSSIDADFRLMVKGLALALALALDDAEVDDDGGLRLRTGSEYHCSPLPMCSCMRYCAKVLAAREDMGVLDVCDTTMMMRLVCCVVLCCVLREKRNLILLRVYCISRVCLKIGVGESTHRDTPNNNTATHAGIGI
jgi:hypothetical protein